MISPDVFPTDPWCVSETDVELERLAKSETIFALSNGHVGLRGNLDEGDPHGRPGSLLNGFYEFMPLPYAEAGYGYPERGQSLINVTNGKIIRLLVDDEPFDIRYGEVISHERTLDMRAGTLVRNVEWRSPSGKRVKIRSTRVVSFEHRAIAGISYEVEAVGEKSRIVVQSSLVANEPVPQRIDDPRAAAALRSPLIPEFHTIYQQHALLGHTTQYSQLRLVAGMDHIYDGPKETRISTHAEEDLARVTFSTRLEPGERLRLTKIIGYGWSTTRSMPALRDQVDAAISSVKRTGWDALLKEQRDYLDDFWRDADIQIEGDNRLQQAVRFSLFQAIQASLRAERRPVPAKGLTGRGYDGHTFWDMDTFLLPELTYIAPRSARDALLWRHFTLDKARDRAAELRLEGASYPWRTINGTECSGYWPAGTAAFHINADIADAVRRYIVVTDDQDFALNQGYDILVETARLWMSLGHHDEAGEFRIDGVTGPDEYTAVVDNNVFTNLMAARNLRYAAQIVRQFPERMDEYELTVEELDAWVEAADTMVIPFDEQLGVTAQAEGFTRYRHWDFENTPDEDYPLMMHYPYVLLYRSQVLKQADLVMALYLCGDAFTEEQKRTDFDYYEAITVRDSSLSASTQAIVAAELGYLDLAQEYFRETALVDLHDLAENVQDGIHLASAAATWLVAVAGFGGMRDYGSELSFAPRLPNQLTCISFGLTVRGRRFRVTIEDGHATYELHSSEELRIVHEGEEIVLKPEQPVRRPLREFAPMKTPQRPAGRGAEARRIGRAPMSTELRFKRPRWQRASRQ